MIIFFSLLEGLEVVKQVQEIFQGGDARELLPDNLLYSLQSWHLVNKFVQTTRLDHFFDDREGYDRWLLLEQFLDESAKKADNELADFALAGQAHLKQLHIACIGLVQDVLGGA